MNGAEKCTPKYIGTKRTNEQKVRVIFHRCVGFISDGGMKFIAMETIVNIIFITSIHFIRSTIHFCSHSHTSTMQTKRGITFFFSLLSATSKRLNVVGSGIELRAIIALLCHALNTRNAVNAPELMERGMHPFNASLF